MTSSENAFQEAVSAMGKYFFDVTIICTTDDHQAEYWMDVLGSGLLSSKKVLAVSEDWTASGGAGNGLGTLYAWKKACALAATKYNFDLAAELAAGNVSAALYHTAGKGTRMAPLPASENNNKPGVKLPFGLKHSDGSVRPISVLEAVIRQTGIYASTRQGRLSVFWGDQVFLPTASFAQVPSHHADILCTLLGDTAPTAEEWAAQGLEKYGVIAVVETTDANGSSSSTRPLEAAQVEKVSHETATKMLGELGKIRQVGPSLGSFSVSSAFLEALCSEFDSELTEKVAKLDTDPHFWMPLTLPESSYISLMKQKGTDESESKEHFDRMGKMKKSFVDTVMANDTMGLFGAVDVGKGACWWDYGMMKLYSANTLLLLEKDSSQSNLLRQFLGLDQSGSRVLNSSINSATVDETAYVFSSKIASGSIKESLLANVAAGSIDAEGAIIVNCASSKSIVAGKGAILYNLIDESGEGIVAEAGQVIVGVTDESGQSFALKSRIDIDGGKAWKECLEMNTLSFEDVHKKNFNANIGEIARKRQEKFDVVAGMI